MNPTATTICNVLQTTGFNIAEQMELPGRTQQLAPLPCGIDIAVRNHVLRANPNGLYAHQAKAVEAALAGRDICLATPTASGKSLVFMAVAVHLVRSDPSVSVMALYPARALIQDQIGKWGSLLEPLGIRFGYIDGGVPTNRRPAILETSRIVLMTPDVAHAWFMSHLDEASVGRFRKSLRLLILDEAHVYEGVFGTNMAYFLRRLEAAAGKFQVIASTATLGEPQQFFASITGRRGDIFGPEDDASPMPPKTILLAREMRGKEFESKVGLLAGLASASAGRFLAFADSRKSVEQFVAALRRGRDSGDNGSEEGHREIARSGSASHAGLLADGVHGVLPYRAGYEPQDRNEIQAALGAGGLAGVVSTSALELGLDIGEVDVVVLLNLPPSMSSFWQRIGRCGRMRPGVCVLIDDRGMILRSGTSLAEYVRRPLEPNWLYLDNRYIQYANALCAAAECRQLARTSASEQAFGTLPRTFTELLKNEITPQQSVPHDLYLLKQQAEAGPHYEFPLRSCVEKNFEIVEGTGSAYSMGLGHVTLSQALREAYPGAIYYYMAKPYRVVRFDYREGKIRVRPDRYCSTQPLAQTMVFPQFGRGLLSLRRSEHSFVAETTMQVSERVTGFVENRGGRKTTYEYDGRSPYYHRPLNRFFQTTGVCWRFPRLESPAGDLATTILHAFCEEFGVQERDIGVGMFHSEQSPLGTGKCQGMCIFDATYGSLRLTQQLAENFPSVVTKLHKVLEQIEPGSDMLRDLQTMQNALGKMELVRVGHPVEPQAGSGIDEWVEVVAPGEQAMFLSESGTRPVNILGYRYTPQGLVYDLEPPHKGARHYISAEAVEPIYGRTRTIWVNLTTGDEVEEPPCNKD